MPDSISVDWKAVVVGALSGAALTAGVLWLFRTRETAPEDHNNARPPARVGMLSLIGSTPVIEIKSLSEATGCRILGKVEWMNPGGSTKDRIAAAMIEDAEKRGALQPGGTVYEGTAGSTGISLALVARAKGYGCVVYVPEDQAVEKVQLLEKLGACVHRVKVCGWADPNHYAKLAATAARSDPKGFYADQFENPANWRAHYASTGPELWEQVGPGLDAVVLGAGTGGTLAGVSRFLRERKPDVKVYLADPQGSCLYNRVKTGVCFSAEDREGKRRRAQVDSIVEGIGLKRLSANFLEASIDSAFSVTDQEVVSMSRFLIASEGLFVGSSTCVNLVAAVRAARELGTGHTIATILCDSGSRHLTRLWNDEFLAGRGLDGRSTPLTLDFINHG